MQSKEVKFKDESNDAIVVSIIISYFNNKLYLK
jgi:hypothetical protein